MNVTIGNISPTPSDEEVAAISAAVTMMWPQPVVAVQQSTKINELWRFSGRWWATDAISRRGRPGR
jgi:hypothetical protein